MFMFDPFIFISFLFLNGFASTHSIRAKFESLQNAPPSPSREKIQVNRFVVSIYFYEAEKRHPFIRSFITLRDVYDAHLLFHFSCFFPRFSKCAFFSLYHTHSNLSCWIYTLETLLFSTTIFVEEGKKTCVPCVYDGVNNNNKRKTLGTQTTKVKTKANPTTTPSSPPSYLSIQTNTLTNS